MSRNPSLDRLELPNFRREPVPGDPGGSGIQFHRWRHKKSILLKASDGASLAVNFIRPYAICVTPKFLFEESSQTPATVPLYPDQIVGQPALTEGAAKTVQVNAYERNPEARRKCIEHYGAVCVVCETRLSDVYGTVADGLIHVHHLAPLADAGDSRLVDPVVDLRPLCPNCHAVIHRRVPPLEIEELRDLMAKARG